jgi:hypothetical protein
MKFRYALFVILASVAPFTASAQTTSTPRPRPVKPNFAPLAFLIGNWTCTRTLSGRAPVGTTDTVTVDPGGYWLVETERVPAHASFPYATTHTDQVTYDGVAKRWVDLAFTNFGSYNIDTSNGFAGHTWAWHHELYSKSSETASMTDFVLTKVNDSRTTATISLIMTSGKRINGTRTCDKLRP